MSGSTVAQLVTADSALGGSGHGYRGQEASSLIRMWGWLVFDVFINYRKADARFGAAATFELLAGRFGRSRVFLDNQSMGPGSVYPEQIRTALNSMRVLVVLIGPMWLIGPENDPSPILREDDWVRREIRVALARGIPIVPVLVDGAKLPPPASLPDDVRPLLFRQATEVHHHTFGADVAGLAQHLEQFLPAWRPADRAVPHQLPASTRLVGREEELVQLDRLLRSDGDRAVPIIVLSGIAGVGKTALATKWAHRATDDFPDGQLYVDLRGFGPDEPVTPMAALSAFLRALGVSRPEELTDLAERSARFRTLMSGRRAVVVLDNARSAKQVEPLLPGTGATAVIVTSRDVLGELRVRHSTELVRLEALAAPDGVRLLTAGVEQRAALEPGAADRLADLCEGLPLALCIVTERLVAQPALSLAALVAELDDERARLAALSSLGSQANVRTVFSWSYRQIDEGQAAVFRAAGLCPARGFDAATIAAVTGRAHDSVERALANLHRAHLVTYLGGHRYGMHDLLHAYAAEVARAEHDPPPDEVPRRLFDYYLHSAARANQLLTPHRVRIPLTGALDAGREFPNADAAKQWLAVEESNLVAISRHDDPALDEHRWQLAYVLRDYFYLTRQLDGWLETHQQALRAAIRSGNDRAEGVTRNNLGMAMTALDRLDDAMSHFTIARDIFERLDDRMGVSNSLANIASVLRRRGDPAQALTYQRIALAHYREMGSANHVGITLRGMAHAYLQLGQAQEAVHCAQEAVDLATWLVFPLDIAQANNILGGAYRQLGKLTLAEIAFQQALEMSMRCGSAFEQAWAHRGLGAVAVAEGRPEDALRQWTAAMRLYRDVGSTLAGEVAADVDRFMAARESST